MRLLHNKMNFQDVIRGIFSQTCNGRDAAFGINSGAIFMGEESRYSTLYVLKYGNVNDIYRISVLCYFVII